MALIAWMTGKCMKLTLIGGALVSLLSACGEGAVSAPVAQGSATVGPTTKLERAVTSGEATVRGMAGPKAVDRALRLGDAVTDAVSWTTLQDIRFPYPPGSYREPETGQQFLGAYVEQCIDKDTQRLDGDGQPHYSTDNGDWYAAAPDGTQIAGGPVWVDWPAPKFPEYIPMTPGECLEGWITIEVPIGMTIDRVVWRPGGETTAEWLP